MGWVSSLISKPQHVKAIGMISIETANLEIALADLMAAVLRVQRDVAHAIYFTPRASTLRIEILLQASKKRLATWHSPGFISDLDKRRKNALNQVERITKIGKGIFQRRHDIIHDGWALSGTQKRKRVVRYKIGEITHTTKNVTVKLSDLTSLLRDMRGLIDHVRDLTEQLKAGPASMIDLKNPITNSGSSALTVRRGNASSRK